MNASTRLLADLLERGVYLERFAAKELRALLPILEQAHEEVLGKIAATGGEWTQAWLAETAANIERIYNAAAEKLSGQLHLDLEPLATEEADWTKSALETVTGGLSVQAPAAATLWAGIKALPAVLALPPGCAPDDAPAEAPDHLVDRLAVGHRELDRLGDGRRVVHPERRAELPESRTAGGRKRLDAGPQRRGRGRLDGQAARDGLERALRPVGLFGGERFEVEVELAGELLRGGVIDALDVGRRFGEPGLRPFATGRGDLAEDLFVRLLENREERAEFLRGEPLEVHTAFEQVGEEAGGGVHAAPLAARSATIFAVAASFSAASSARRSLSASTSLSCSVGSLSERITSPATSASKSSPWDSAPACQAATRAARLCASIGVGR